MQTAIELDKLSRGDLIRLVVELQTENTRLRQTTPQGKTEPVIRPIVVSVLPKLAINGEPIE